MNATNKKVAELETQNVRLNDFNSKMYEICKTKDVFKNLEEKNRKELESQNKVFKEKSETKSPDPAGRHGNKPRHLKTKSTPLKDESKSKCLYYESGFCRQEIRCSFQHPQVMCIQFWSHGECDQGDKCQRRHPVQVCIKYLNNTCPAGRNCVHQHPQNQNNPSQTKPSPKSPSSPMLIDEQRSPFFSNGFVGSNLKPNVNIPSVPIPTFFPSVTTRLSAQQTFQSAAPHAGTSQQYGRYDQQEYRQGNGYGHPGQQPGQGWPQ